VSESNACRERGLAAYRAGDWDGALAWSRKSREHFYRQAFLAQNLMVESMALHQLGKPAEALDHYRRGVEFAATAFPAGLYGVFLGGPNWLDWIGYAWPRREAAQLLGIDGPEAAGD
jgi:hypothetical protein